MRRVTMGEATAAEVPRGSFVGMLTSCVDLWIPCYSTERGWFWMHLDDDDKEVPALEEYWRQK